MFRAKTVAENVSCRIVFDKVPTKARPRFRGHAYTPKKTKAAEAKIKAAWLEQVGDTITAINGEAVHLPEFTGAVHVAVSVQRQLTKSDAKRDLYKADTKLPDADNVAKLLDALNGVAWKDDRQITRLTVEKLPLKAHTDGKATITLRVSYYTEELETCRN